MPSVWGEIFVESNVGGLVGATTNSSVLRLKCWLDSAIELVLENQWSFNLYDILEGTGLSILGVSESIY